MAGAGVLDLAAALSGTIAVYPTSLNFGTGTGTLWSTLSLSVLNTGTAAGTYRSWRYLREPDPFRSLSISYFRLEPNDVQPLLVTIGASGLTSGEYQGYLRISGPDGSSVATVPYWFAVPGSAPYGISVLYQKFSAAAGADLRQAIVFRVTDVAGLPYWGPLQPAVNVIDSGGGGGIRGPYAAGRQTGHVCAGRADGEHFVTSGNHRRTADPRCDYRSEVKRHSSKWLTMNSSKVARSLCAREGFYSGR